MLPNITVVEPGIRPHCKYCGGRGLPGEKAEKVKSALKMTYRIPLSHTACKRSVLSLSLSLSLSLDEPRKESE